MAAERTWVVGQAEHGGYDREHALEVLSDIESVMHLCGGMVSCVTVREPIGEAPDGSDIVASTGLVFKWSSFSPLQPARAAAPVVVEPEPAGDTEGPEAEVEPEPVEA